MNRIAALAAMATLAFSTLAIAQAPAERGDASKDMTNCAPGSTTGTSSQDAQAVEKSAILPSAEAHEQSAAPTVQRDGKSVEASTDCPQDPAQPKAAAPKG